MGDAGAQLSDFPRPGLELRRVRRLVELKGRRILELGCGDGRLTRELTSLASSVVAVEPDRTSVLSARRAAAAEGTTNVAFRVGFAERVRVGGAPFDVAFFSWSL
jgi:ubiquinone/menaquinone biosynthesis C-methylase UbiE